MQEMQHKLEQEKLENLNFKKRVNREREKMVQAREQTTRARDDFDR